MNSNTPNSKYICKVISCLFGPENLDRFASKSRAPPGAVEKFMKQLQGQISFDDFNTMDLVIEVWYFMREGC